MCPNESPTAGPTAPVIRRILLSQPVLLSYTLADLMELQWLDHLRTNLEVKVRRSEGLSNKNREML